MSETLKETCVRLEHFETPEWAAKAILNREILAGWVIDPCCGAGVLSRAALRHGYQNILSWDIHDWGFDGQTRQIDFLDPQILPENSIPESGRYHGFTVFMNPPFSKAVEFVEKSFELGARKIVCFQRFAWWESQKRRYFWEKYPPNRVYICGDRADCWRHDIPLDGRGSSSPTAHAWFVWEQGQPPGTQLGHIYKPRAA